MRYKHVIFDVDGTLLDTEYASLTALRDIVRDFLGRKMDIGELAFAFSLPAETTLGRLGFRDVEAGRQAWLERTQEYFHAVRKFQGIEDTLKSLKAMGCSLGIVTSKNRDEYATDMPHFGLSGWFDTVICFEDAAEPKPSPLPMLRYLELAGAGSGESLFVGDSIHDSQCASAAGVDFALAMWGTPSPETIKADYYPATPAALLDIVRG